MDESGTSGQEANLVVAGVFIHADPQWMPVAAHIDALIDKYVAEEDRDGFCFHAKDIFSGTGKIWGQRQKYSLAHRCEALKEFLSIPAKFQLPVVFGFIRREAAPQPQTTQDRRESVATDHSLAFCYCAIGAERSMRKYAPSEVAKMVVEDTDDAKKHIKLMHNILRGRRPIAREYIQRLTTKLDQDSLPITKIVDAVSFEGKREAVLLQIADACALMIRFLIEGRPDIADFVSALALGNPQRIIQQFEKVRPFFGGSCELKCWD